MSGDAFVAALRGAAPEFGLRLDEVVVERFRRHYELLAKWNQRVNLTRIQEPAAVARSHFLESSLGAGMIVAQATRLVDVGSGAGFPGLPIACLRTDLEVVLVEANGRKAAFLKEAVRSMGLDRVSVENVRFDPAMFVPSDVLAARAVDRLRDLLPDLMASSAHQVLLFASPDLLDEAPRLAPERRRPSIVHVPGTDRRQIASFVSRETPTP